MATAKAYRIDAVIQTLISVKYDLGVLQVANHRGTDYVTLVSLTRCLGVGPTTLYNHVVKPTADFKEIVAKVPVVTDGTWAKETRTCMIPVSMAPVLLSTLGQGRAGTYSHAVRNNIAAMIKDIVPAVELELGRPVQTLLAQEPALAVRPVVIHKIKPTAARTTPKTGIANVLAGLLLKVPGPERSGLATKLVGNIKKMTGASDIFELNEEQECLALIALANGE